jgi:hypothetical protein
MRAEGVPVRGGSAAGEAGEGGGAIGEGGIAVSEEAGLPVRADVPVRA